MPSSCANSAAFTTGRRANRSATLHPAESDRAVIKESAAWRGPTIQRHLTGAMDEITAQWETNPSTAQCEYTDAIAEVFAQNDAARGTPIAWR